MTDHDRPEATLTAVMRRLLTDPPRLARVVAFALTAAGSEDEWDSGTIERVLDPIQTYAEQVGMPLVGDTGSDDEALRFWCSVADSAGIERPPYEFDEEESPDGRA